ncbi:glycoside hydrolase family 73 protein [Companilactobacillus sp.]|uniref:glycoside hydrolase family 73 protein n=1 Tax=Companilactobacillus sp. TaxID=2767905 RepID=UPI0025BE55E4|nr:glycoside hydrolase family 73 protein [Companilactobacillus sp.]MCH4008933.1 glycoside hydrolase family 73 protein [Companilactobacillus sp.]MCH4050888.1 glycoside hydrolase family 73 protein [Companilactobacillus sp.]MCH4076876.1 glycoside hydrolase family 73 protein [Companilactobacillus sp.]MCH4125451.1 glycoside hydrolase family 73 protein [Companilactobacillus sp.]MCH4131993.1 glycoside hydrolase family 73 protein [Companilactobacillus sp.]
MPQKKRTKPRRRRRRKNSNQNIYMIVAVLVVLVLGFFGYRTYQQHQQRDDASNLVAKEHNAFIKKVAPEAIELGHQYGVLPSITIGQAILESDWGNSTLASKYNNYFGIKGEDPSNTVVLQTREYTDGQWVTINGRFRSYSDYRESMKDHALLLVNGTTWNSAQYQQVISSKDYIEAAVSLQTDGYATDPGYTTKIIHVIQKYDLMKYDQGIK